jgi:hypothetical protein
MPVTKILIASVTVLTVFAVARDAHAICGTIVTTDASEQVVVGELGTESCPPAIGCYATGSGVLAACIIDDEGNATLATASCGDATADGNQVQIQTQGGNDRLAALLPEHGPPAAYFKCGAGTSAILPWPADWNFGIAAFMGVGMDEFHGTSKSDWVISSQTVGVADGAFDLMCGNAGDDFLHGDGDDNVGAFLEEMMYGGPGTDFCDGDPGLALNGSNSSDAYNSCENPLSADAKDARLSNVPVTQCSLFANPLNW